MAREPTLSHFGERANLLPELEAVFREYGATGRGDVERLADQGAVQALVEQQLRSFGELLPGREGAGLDRDKAARGYSTEAVTDVILRRMPDYVTTICPQFTNTDINSR
jgi:phosphoribulokinase